jgi:hypothetical protein
VEYGFRFTLTVVQRKPVRRVVSLSDKYCSETEILKAIDLLGRDGYDFIWKCGGYVHMEMVVEKEDRAAFENRLKRLSGSVSCDPPLSMAQPRAADRSPSRATARPAPTAHD